MKRLKIVINKLSGNGEKAYDKIILDKLKHRFPDEEYTVTEVIMIADEKDTFELDECDAVADRDPFGERIAGFQPAADRSRRAAVPYRAEHRFAGRF